MDTATIVVVNTPQVITLEKVTESDRLLQLSVGVSSLDGRFMPQFVHLTDDQERAVHHFLSNFAEVADLYPELESDSQSEILQAIGYDISTLQVLGLSVYANPVERTSVINQQKTFWKVLLVRVCLTSATGSFEMDHDLVIIPS